METVLEHHDKSTLREMAIENGLTRSGWRGRFLSQMRKKDFISYLVFREEEISRRLDIEDEFVGLLQGMFSMHIDGLARTSGASNERGGRAITRFNMFDHDRIFIEFSTSNTPSDADAEESAHPERVPLDQDELVPDMTVESNLKNVEDKIACVVCKENMKNTVFLGCNHSATCIKCANSKYLKECPLCRKKIEKVIRIF